MVFIPSSPADAPGRAKPRTDLFTVFVLALTLSALMSQIVVVIWLGSH